MPLKSLEHQVNIHHSIANVTLSLEYFNDSDKILNTNFFFAMSPHACFDGLKAIIGDKEIKGLVKQKEEAKKEYEEGL